MRQSKSSYRWSLLLAVAVLAGCATTPFSLSFPDNKKEPLELALARVKEQPLEPKNASPTAFLVTQKSDKIIAYDLVAKRIRWQVQDTVASRIVVAQGRIFHMSANNTLVSRNVSDGARGWSVKLRGGTRLLGLAADGGRVFYAVEVTGGKGGQGVAAYVGAVDGSTGKALWEQPCSGRLGAPAARDGLVFVPLRFQSISILDALKGEELTRLRSKEEALLWVRSTPTGVYFGGKTGVYRLDPKAIAGTRSGSTFVAGALPESVRPAYWWDGYNAALAGYTAFDRNRLLWRLQDKAPQFLSNTIYVHNYRFFFAFEGPPAKAGRDKPTTTDPRGQRATTAAKQRSGQVAMVNQSGKAAKVAGNNLRGGEIDAQADEASLEQPAKLKWAYSFPRYDVVASYHTGKALVLVSVRGDIVVLDLATGLPVSLGYLKLSLRGASFDALGFKPAEQPKGKPNLQRALTEMIWDPDRRFGEVKLFGIQQLSKLSGAKIAKALVQIVTRPGINARVYKRAGNMIVSRHDKAAIPLYLKVLKTRYDFLDGTQPRAVDIMARALGDLRAPEAVQPLLLHLADHETPLAAVVHIVRALKAIGDKSVVEPLRDFLLTYRCEAQFKKAPEALNAVADALLALGGEEERQLLGFVGNDSHSLKSLRVYLATALRQDKVRPGKQGAASPKSAAAMKK